MMDSLVLKYRKLNKTAQHELDDFLDFLLFRQQKSKQGKSYKEKIMNVSTWSEKDINELQDGAQNINNWNPEQW